MVAGVAAPGVGGTGPPTDNCGAHARELAYAWVGCRGLVKLVAFDRWTESCRNKVEHFARAGMSLEGRLREEQLAIEGHFDPAAAIRQQGRAGDPRRPRVEELSHQTGGSLGVVSDDAELALEFVPLVGRFGLH